MPFVKLDCGILDSSLWAEPPAVRLTFLTMLAMAESDGLCRATAPGIARRGNLPQPDVEQALKVLSGPDPHSRDNTDGRRIERVAGGYHILNYLGYREYDYGAAERMRALRARRKESNVTGVTANARNVRRTSPNASASASVFNAVNGAMEGGVGGTAAPPRTVADHRALAADFELFWEAWPKKVGKQIAMRAWVDLRPPPALVHTILSAVGRWKKTDSWQDEGGRFIPQPGRWLAEQRWTDVPPKSAAESAKEKAAASEAEYRRVVLGEKPNA